MFRTRTLSTLVFAALLSVGVACATKYSVKIRTSDLPKAGTDANVTLNLLGSKGSHALGPMFGGKRIFRTKTPIYRSDKNGKRVRTGYRIANHVQNHFERGATDSQDFELNSLGTLRQITVSHDNRGAGAGWHLWDIIVEADDNGSKTRTVFPCCRWLATSADDGKIVRILDPEQSLTRYIVRVHTGDRKKAGTDARVRLDIEGSTQHEVSSWQLDTPGNPFEKGKVDSFNLYTRDLGELKRLRISHDNSGSGPGWFLQKIVVQRVTAPTKIWRFRFERWLEKGHCTAASTPEN